MRIAYLDCSSGISGDMTLGALIDAGVPAASIQAAIDSLGLPGCRLEVGVVKRKGFRGTKVTVIHEPESAHRHLKHVLEIVERGQLTAVAKGRVEQVFRRLAEAEARVHGTTVEKVHFHEVGAVDSIVDIVGACVGWELLGVDRVVSSAVCVGGGTIEIAHGRCSVPAPATAELLQGIPLAASPIEAELTTPTGAAILACFAEEYGPLPAMTIEAIGYGAGDRDFATHPNLLRILVGTAAGETTQHSALERDVVVCLETHVDDATGEVIAACCQKLVDAGALDVFTTPVGMKKGRPGIQLTVLGPPELLDTLQTILFHETSTIGIRIQRLERVKLRRERMEVPTRFGVVVGKVVRLPRGGERFTAEFESAKDLAERHQVAISEIIRAAEERFREIREGTV